MKPDSRLVELFLEIAKIDGVSGEERDIADFILAQATSSELWATGNVINLDGGESNIAYHSLFKE